MKQKVLSIEQMLHLQRVGLDCSGASMVYRLLPECFWNTEKYYLTVRIESQEDKEAIPAFCLQDILSILPVNIGWNSLYISKGDEWNISYESRNTTTDTITLIEFSSDVLLEASYQLLCWCIDNNYIKTK